MAKETVIVELNVEADKATKSVQKFGKEVDNSKESTQELTGLLDNATGGAVGKFKNLKGTIGSVTSSFKSLRVAVLASGIGALALGVLALVQAFKRSEEGQNKFAKLMEVIGAITNVILDRVANLGTALINLFTNPIESLKDFSKSLNTFVIDKFNNVLDAVGMLGSAFKKVFEGDFKGALSDAKDGIIALNNELNPAVIVTNALVKETANLVKEMKEEALIAAQIADKRAKADKQERELLVARAKANREVAELREKAADKENINVEDRIKFLIEAGKIEEDITKREIENARLRLEAKQQENALGLSTKEDKEEEAKLEAELINLETARLKLQKSLTAEITSARREAEAEAKAKQAELDAEIKAAEEKERARQDGIKGIQDEYKKRAEDEEAETELQKLELEKQRALTRLENLNATEQQKLDVIQYYANREDEIKQKNADNDLAREKMVQQAKIKLVSDSLGLVTQILGENSKAGKAAAIAQATINSFLAFTDVLKTPTTIPEPFGSIQKGISAASILASGIATVKKIASVKALGAGGGGGAVASSGGQAQAQAPSFNLVGSTGTNQLATAIGGQNKEPVKAYVVGNEISSQQELDRKTRDTASI